VRRKLGLGVGVAARFAKAPVGTLTFLGDPKRLSTLSIFQKVKEGKPSLILDMPEQKW